MTTPLHVAKLELSIHPIKKHKYVAIKIHALAKRIKYLKGLIYLLYWLKEKLSIALFEICGKYARKLTKRKLVRIMG